MKIYIVYLLILLVNSLTEQLNIFIVILIDEKSHDFFKCNRNCRHLKYNFYFLFLRNYFSFFNLIPNINYAELVASLVSLVLLKVKSRKL